MFTKIKEYEFWENNTKKPSHAELYREEYREDNVQLTLEQHGFEEQVSTASWIFFNRYI